jgi:hypothetical protein
LCQYVTKGHVETSLFCRVGERGYVKKELTEMLRGIQEDYKIRG